MHLHLVFDTQGHVNKLLLLLNIVSRLPLFIDVWLQVHIDFGKVLRDLLLLILRHLLRFLALSPLLWR